MEAGGDVEVDDDDDVNIPSDYVIMNILESQHDHWLAYARCPVA